MASALKTTPLVGLKKTEAESLLGLQDTSLRKTIAQQALKNMLGLQGKEFFGEKLGNKQALATSTASEWLSNTERGFPSQIVKSLFEDVIQKAPWITIEGVAKEDSIVRPPRQRGISVQFSDVLEDRLGYFCLTIVGHFDNLNKHVRGLSRYFENLQLTCWQNKLPIEISVHFEFPKDKFPKQDKPRFGGLEVGVSDQISVKVNFRHKYQCFRVHAEIGSMSSYFKWKFPQKLNKFNELGKSAFFADSTPPVVNIPTSWLTREELRFFGMPHPCAPTSKLLKGVALTGELSDGIPKWYSDLDIVHRTFRTNRFHCPIEECGSVTMTPQGEEYAKLSYSDFFLSGRSVLVLYPHLHKMLITLSRLVVSDDVDKFFPE